MDSCNKCGWNNTSFDSTYYRINEEEQIFDLSDWDLVETGLELPEGYYPKISDLIDFVNEDGELYQEWKETFKCPKCGNVFTILNSNY